jgi:putative inorganic carbon (HCO3(-)) transporter
LQSLPKQFPTMADSMQSHLGAEARRANADDLPGWTFPALLGLAAGIAAALFVTVHWTIAVVGALVVVALSVIENEKFLLAVIFLLPVSWTLPAGTLRDVMTPLRILVLVGFFAGRMLRGELDWRRLFASPISRISVLFLSVAVATVAIGPVGWGHDSLAQAYRLVSWVGFYFFGLAWIESRRRLRQVMMALLASVCLLGLYSILQEAVDGYTTLWLHLTPPGSDYIPWNGRAPSLVSYSTSLAGYVDISLPFALAAWVAGRGQLKKLGGAALGLGSVALVFSQSLGGLMSFGFVLALAIYCFVRSWRRRTVLFGGLAAVAAAFYLARHVLNPAHFADASRVMAPDIVVRLLQFQSAWVVFIHHPLTGIGFGNFGEVSGNYLPSVSWMPSASQMASSLYLTLLAETGVVGLAIFVYLMFLVARKAWAQMSSAGESLGLIVAFGTFGAVSAVLVHGLTDYLFMFSPQYGTLVWLVFALLVVNSTQKPSASGSEAASRVGSKGSACA